MYIQRGMDFIQHHLVYSDPKYIDHPPLGWIIPSLIFKATDFPDSIIHVLSSTQNLEQDVALLFLVPRLIAVAFTMAVSVLVYKISSNMYEDRNLALCSLASFAVIPAIWPFRNLLIDTIMITFVLSSLYVILPKKKIKNNLDDNKRKFWQSVLFSGFLFGIALFVKLTAIFFLPAIILFVLGHGTILRNQGAESTSHKANDEPRLQTTGRQKILAILLWLVPSIVFLVSWLEFFIMTQHTLQNLISTQLWELKRGSFSYPGIAMPLLLMTTPLGVVFGVYGLVRTTLQRENRRWSILGLPYLGFLFRGGYVGWVHTIPMIPVMSIYAGRPLYQLSKLLFYRFNKTQSRDVSSDKIANYLVVSLLILSIVITVWLSSFDEAKSDRDAIVFLIGHLPSHSILVTDPGYGWVIKIFRPDVNVIDYYMLEKMETPPNSFYIAEKSYPSKYDPTLHNLDALYEKSCPVQSFENKPNNLHPYSLVQDKWWNVQVRYYDTRGCNTK